jgi:hypothetical protein
MIYQVQHVKRNFAQFNFCVIKENTQGVFNYYGGYNNPWRAACAVDDCGGGIIVEPKNIKIINYIN